MEVVVAIAVGCTFEIKTNLVFYCKMNFVMLCSAYGLFVMEECKLSVDIWRYQQ